MYILKIRIIASQDSPRERKQRIAQKIGWDATSVATAFDGWRIKTETGKEVKQCRNPTPPYMTVWNQACRIRMTNNPEEKSTHYESGRLFYTAFIEIYNSVKCAKKFWYLGIFPLNLGTFTQDFIHAYLEMANTEDHVRENGLLGILPPSAEVITNVHPAPNVIRNANLTSENNSFLHRRVLFWRSLVTEKEEKQLTQQ